MTDDRTLDPFSTYALDPFSTYVLGVDPGARETGIVVLDVTDTPGIGVAPLAHYSTIRRTDTGRPDQVPADYLDTVTRAVVKLAVDLNVAAIGVEGIRAPGGFAKGRRHLIDPAGIIGAAITYGAILGALGRAALGHRVRVVRPAGNGNLLPLHAYPEPLGTRGKGKDKHRHARSAYDVALMARHSPPAHLEGY